ncbi:MAG: holo-ACP synthase [Rhodocyclales bacterium]|nr:holo-ACP synthase [Rhodocyclales bacterium]
MIFGVGTDIVIIARLTSMWARHGERVLARILAPEEFADFRRATDPGRFLAKRFAAKEALGKALGTGLRAPVSLSAIAIAHDSHGKPYFRLAPDLAAYLAERRLTAHISISDERDCALAFTVVEQQ